MRLRAPLALALLLAPGLAAGALPPKFAAAKKVRAMERTTRDRDRAPTKVVLQVVSASGERAGRCPVIEHVRLKGKVTKVLRAGADAVKPGATLEVTYVRRFNECPGPRIYNNGRPREGATVSALLRCKGTACEPAVGFAAFWDDAKFARELAEARAASADPAAP